MNILLGVTGSIASYKSYDLARLLVKSGHSVKVVLTSGALEFIRPETFRYLGIEATYLPHDDFTPSLLSKESSVLHVELAKWADKIVIAPASANTLSRMATGITNDLLTSIFLALGKKPVLIFPAMNTEMWYHPRIIEHRNFLDALINVCIVNPVSGLLACGDVGAGKFPDVQAITDLIESIPPGHKMNKRVLITAGATASPLDPVRYVTNPSSGRMGISVAKAFLSRGYEVTVLAGYQCSAAVENLTGHPHFTLLKTPTTNQMKEAALREFPAADLYISTGAIADIEFEVATEKLKKESLGSALPFRQAPDILKEVLKLKKNQKIISFAAETDLSKVVLMEKMKRKPVDLMIGNKVSNGLVGTSEVQGFQANEGDYYLVEASEVHGPKRLSKFELGIRLVEWFEGKPAW